MKRYGEGERKRERKMGETKKEKTEVSERERA